MDYHFMTDFYGDENTSDDDVELTISDPVKINGRVQVLVRFHRHSSRTGHDDYMAEQQRQQEEAARAAEEAARQAEENRRQQEEAARQLEEWQNTLRNGGAVDHSYRGQ